MPVYLYELPPALRADLVPSLDASEAWRDLAARCLEYTQEEIEVLSGARYKPGTSPADALLTRWGQRMGSADELFLHLHALGLHRSMGILKPCVSRHLHGFIKVPPPQTTSPRRPHESPSSPPPVPFVKIRNDNLEKSSISTVRDATFSTRIVTDKGALFDGEELLIAAGVPDETRDGNLHPRTNEETPIKRVASPQHHKQQQQYQCPPRPSTQPLAVPAPNIAPSAPPPPLGNSPQTGGSVPTAGSSATNLSLSQRLRTPSGVPLPREAFLNNVPFDVLKEACNNFDRAGLLGHGGFGEVFRGKWNGQDVAVKRILEEKRGNMMVDTEAYQRTVNQAITELHTLHSYPAENILPLLAISFDPDFATEPCLVYQLMPRGSVADRLRRRGGTQPLTWEQRANIALGTARGLRHLHACNIIHGDIKSGNVLLDRHFEPKIGDFGLARGGPEADHSFLMVSMVKGTQAYLPEDYIRSHQLTAAVDTFCYGIFMFELVSAKSPSMVPPVNNPHRMSIRELMLASNYPGEWVDESAPTVDSHWAHLLFYVGKDCARKMRRQRPQIEVVLDNLDKLFQQPSAALALQVFYDDHRQVSTTSDNNVGHNSFSGIPEVLGSHLTPASKETSIKSSGAATTADNTTSTTTNTVQDSSASATADTFTASSFTIPLDNSGVIENHNDLIDFDPEPSLPNLSAFMTKKVEHDDGVPDLSKLGLGSCSAVNPNVTVPSGNDGIPDLSLFNMGGGCDGDDRLSAVESALANVADLDPLRS